MEINWTERCNRYQRFHSSWVLSLGIFRNIYFRFLKIDFKRLMFAPQWWNSHEITNWVNEAKTLLHWMGKEITLECHFIGCPKFFVRGNFRSLKFDFKSPKPNFGSELLRLQKVKVRVLLQGGVEARNKDSIGMFHSFIANITRHSNSLWKVQLGWVNDSGA